MHPDHHDLPLGSLPARPGSLRATAATVYGVLALVWLTIPGPVAGWCDDHADWAAARLFGVVAHGVEDLSRRLGIASVYEVPRRQFTRSLDP